MKRLKTFIPAAIALVFLAVYHKTFFSDYAYLDEAHQLWHNGDGSNRLMFMVQGRWLTGLLIDQLFGSIHSIAELKNLRIFSLAGWIVTTISWTIIARRWISLNGFTKEVYLLSTLFIIMSPSVAIAIGWASCVEIFVACMFGLLSGSIFFRALNPADNNNPVDNQLLVSPGLSTSVLLITIVFGVCSLFLYQNAFGLFLLPFLIDQYNSKTVEPSTGADDRSKRRLITGIAVYLFVYVVYFLLFLYQVKQGGFARSDRAGITTDLIGKLSFFFGDALPKAFSLNLLNERGSALPLVVAIVMVVALLTSVIFRWRKAAPLFILSRIVVTLLLLLLIYLPSMAVAENFSSHRTLLPLSLAGFLVLMMQLFYFITGKKSRIICSAVIALIISIIGVINYNLHFIAPVRQEYNALHALIRQRYSPAIRTIYFIRPDPEILRSVYGIRPAKDEFGSPSTAREWVPEPLLRQMISGINHNRGRTENISILQFPDSLTFIRSDLPADSATLLINMNDLIRAH